MRDGKIWLLIGGILGVGIIALGWLLGGAPMFARASQSDAQTRQILADNATQQQIVEQMRQQYENIDALRAELDALQLIVPGAPDNEAFFVELAAKAGVAGVTLQSVTVSAAVPYGDMGSTESSGEGSENDTSASSNGLEPPQVPSAELQGQLYVLTVDMQLDADEEQLRDFLGALQTSGTRLILVTDVTSSFGATQRTDLTGYLFVVHDPRLGAIGSLPTPAPEATEEPTAEPTDAATETPSPEATETPAG